jgi:hypothetical protein
MATLSHVELQALGGWHHVHGRPRRGAQSAICGAGQGGQRGSLASAATAKSGRPRARIPGRAFSHCARPRLRQPVGIAQHIKFHPQQAVGTGAAQSGRAMPLSSTARRNAMTQMRRPGPPAPALPGRDVTRWCAAPGTKPTHYISAGGRGEQAWRWGRRGTDELGGDLRNAAKPGGMRSVCAGPGRFAQAQRQRLIRPKEAT